MSRKFITPTIQYVWSSKVEEFLSDSSPRVGLLYIHPLFFARIILDQEWSLFEDNVSNQLFQAGDNFDNLYQQLEQKPELIVKKVSSKSLFQTIIQMQMQNHNFTWNNMPMCTAFSSNFCTRVLEPKS